MAEKGGCGCGGGWGLGNSGGGEMDGVAVAKKRGTSSQHHGNAKYTEGCDTVSSFKIATVSNVTKGANTKEKESGLRSKQSVTRKNFCASMFWIFSPLFLCISHCPFFFLSLAWCCSGFPSCCSRPWSSFLRVGVWCR